MGSDPASGLTPELPGFSGVGIGMSSSAATEPLSVPAGDFMKSSLARILLLGAHAPVIRYFARLSASKLTLWCYLAWYVTMVCLYFDPAPLLWISSVGISALIGIALNLSTHEPGRRNSFWVVFRLFLMPFCVSSYAALIKGKGFILLFPPHARELMIGAGACLAVVGWHWGCKALCGAEKDRGLEIRDRR